MKHDANVESPLPWAQLIFPDGRRVQERLAEQIRVHLDLPAAARRQVQHIFAPALERSQAQVRPATRARSFRDRDKIGKLIADEREGAVEECGDEYLVPGHTGGYGAIGLVEDFYDEQVLEHMESRGPRALLR